MNGERVARDRTRFAKTAETRRTESRKRDETPVEPRDRLSPAAAGAALACLFASGVAGLVAEVCWIRRAALAFGSTIDALSTVLAVFFLGLALGSYLFGERSPRIDRPLRAYALLEIAPPEGVVVDPKRRPYVIIDPRAGHGPGIGGFKDDSQVGVALRAGHPVYFVVFYHDPEPGQTLLDVCEAEKQFVRKVRELHPDSPKPAIVGTTRWRM